MFLATHVCGRATTAVRRAVGAAGPARAGATLLATTAAPIEARLWCVAARVPLLPSQPTGASRQHVSVTTPLFGRARRARRDGGSVMVVPADPRARKAARSGRTDEEVDGGSSSSNTRTARSSGRGEASSRQDAGSGGQHSVTRGRAQVVMKPGTAAVPSAAEVAANIAAINDAGTADAADDDRGVERSWRRWRAHGAERVARAVARATGCSRRAAEGVRRWCRAAARQARLR